MKKAKFKLGDVVFYESNYRKNKPLPWAMNAYRISKIKKTLFFGYVYDLDLIDEEEEMYVTALSVPEKCIERKED